MLKRKSTKKLVVSVLLPDDSLVEAGRLEDTAGLQPRILPGKNFLKEKVKRLRVIHLSKGSE